jgi:hypothetical protein
MTETEETLRYWLAQEDWYPSRYTQNFLNTNPADVANETLARIAEDAQPEPHSYGALLYTAFATIGFMPSAGGKVLRRKSGVRAALLLAERNDGRCVPALIRVFETEAVWQNKYQEQIVTGLTRYLAKTTDDGNTVSYTEEVAELIARIWNHAQKRDLSPSLARLLLSAASYLRAPGANHAILRTIAESEPPRPIRREVRDRLRAA